MARLIERGFDDASHHDCFESGCLLAGGDEPDQEAAPPPVAPGGSR